MKGEKGRCDANSTTVVWRDVELTHNTLRIAGASSSLDVESACALAECGADTALVARPTGGLATTDGSISDISTISHEKRRTSMRLISTILTVFLYLSVTPAFAEKDISQGTPITSENAGDVLEIQRVVTNLTDGVDSQKWDVIRDILEDKVDTTIGETEPGVSKIKSAEEIIARWKGFYESAEKLVIHHVTSNDRVFFHDADTATVNSKGVIVLENTPAGKHASAGGTLRGYRWINYVFGVTRTDNGWKVNKVQVEYLVQEFNSLEAKK